MAIGFTFGASKSNASISFVPLLAAVVVFPPVFSVSAAAVTVFVAEAFLRRRPAWLTAFNTGQYILGYGTAALIYSWLAPGGGGDISLIAFLPAALAFFSANLFIVSGFVSVRRGESLIETARQFAGPSGANLFYDFLATPTALFAAYLYTKFYVAGLFLFILPFLLIRYSFISKIRLEQANRDLIRVLIKAIETRDPYTSGHSVRVSTLAKMIAEDLHLSKRRIYDIETAALLHDIGKIEALYADVISKPYSLSDTERALIRTHATKGADLLHGLSAFGPEIIKAVRHHHERFDGQGYPDGISGAAIPLAARIIMLCDSIDAMLSDRPYRSALTVNATYNEIVRCSGTQFDPDIVEVILRRDTLRRAAGLAEAEPTRQASLTAAAAEPV